MDLVLEEFSLCDEYINDINLYSESFRTFCESLKEVSDLIDDDQFILEAVVDQQSKIRKSNSMAIQNTKDTINDVAGIYNKVTDAGGTVYKTEYSLVMKLIKGIAKIITFSINFLKKSINTLSNIAKYPGKITKSVYNKIKGNIVIYITPSDIKDIYNTHLFVRINRLLTLADDFSKGEIWGGFTGIFKNGMKDINGIHPTSNDKQISIEMHKEYDRIKNIEFSPTTIKINSDDVRNIYFTNNKTVVFTDLKGVSHNDSYYESLLRLSNDLQDMKSKMENINSNICEKFNKTEANGTFAKMNNSSRNYIIDTMKMVSGSISIIGNMIKYIMKDVNTMNNNWKTIMDQSSKIDNK